ncbi:hypothetical protein GCM10018780_91650 [Streptomyces lanatus]|nr:hypothetical protein GCM10018780_91650 [Streptomyces lanatus]
MPVSSTLTAQVSGHAADVWVVWTWSGQRRKRCFHAIAIGRWSWTFHPNLEIGMETWTTGVSNDRDSPLAG